MLVDQQNFWVGSAKAESNLLSDVSRSLNQKITINCSSEFSIPLDRVNFFSLPKYDYTLNVIGGWLEIGPNYHITVMFDVYNMGQQLDMKFYAKREHLSSSQQL